MNIEELYPQRARRQFTSIAKEMREEIKHAKEPQLKAILETSSEVLNSLAKTFSDYEIKKEKAWR